MWYGPGKVRSPVDDRRSSGTNWNTWFGRVKAPPGSPLGPGYCSRPMQLGLRPGWPKPWMWEGTVFRIKRRFAEEGLAGGDAASRPEASIPNSAVKLDRVLPEAGGPGKVRSPVGAGAQLEHLVRAGKSTARVTTRARILLKTDAAWSAPRVAQALDVVEGRCSAWPAEEGLAGVPGPSRYRKGGHDQLDPALAGGEGGGVGAGAVLVPRDGAAAPEKNLLKPPFCNGAGYGRSRSGAFPR